MTLKQHGWLETSVCDNRQNLREFAPIYERRYVLKNKREVKIVCPA